jgi:hypothetical protein
VVKRGEEGEEIDKQKGAEGVGQQEQSRGAEEQGSRGGEDWKVGGTMVEIK